MFQFGFQKIGNYYYYSYAHCYYILVVAAQTHLTSISPCGRSELASKEASCLARAATATATVATAVRERWRRRSWGRDRVIVLSK